METIHIRKVENGYLVTVNAKQQVYSSLNRLALGIIRSIKAAVESNSGAVLIQWEK